MHQLHRRVEPEFSGRELVQFAGGVGCVVALAMLLALALPIAVLALLLPGAAATATSPFPIATSSSHSQPAASPATGVGSGPVEVARRYLGVPYVFGGTDPAIGLDCSGLVQLVFRQLGIALPRTAQQQYAATASISREQLLPGDLVFFSRTYADPHDWITHVGIYIGDGMQINAPTTGQVVSIQSVFTGFWGAHFASGARVVRT